MVRRDGGASRIPLVTTPLVSALGLLLLASCSSGPTGTAATPAPPPSDAGVGLGGDDTQDGGSPTDAGTERESGGSCTPRTFVSGSVSPAKVAPGGSYEVLCDYGSVSNAVDTNLEIPGAWGSCSYVGFTGTAARFTCTAGSAAGSYAATCILSDYAPDSSMPGKKP